jgi:hypothetical protein
MKRLKMNDPLDAEEGYEGVIKSTELKPYPSIDGMRSTQRFIKMHNPAAAAVNVDRLIDDRLVKKLDETGFIDQMKKRYRIP